MAMSHSSDKLDKEFDSFSLKFYKSSSSSYNFQRLPKCWNIKDRSKCLRLSHFALTSYSSYDRSLCVGLSTKTSSLNKLPGSEYNSFGYQIDGCICHGSPTSSTKFGPRIGDNDIIGCGVDFLSQSLFFTRNGIFLGKAFEGIVGSGTRLYPTVGLQGRGVRINSNFGQSPFHYAFDNYIKNERMTRENKLVEKICKEDFAGPKMKELVSGYLVHHGYIATAKAFSNWSSLSQSTNQHYKKPESDVKTAGKHSLASELTIDSCEDQSETKTFLQRRHSDSSCISPANINSKVTNQLPGIASMLHRRRLRALCRHCQYGKAASTLNRLYPQVLEKCPELLVQLRCRQLIEMMRRHAVRRGYNNTCNSNNESTDSSSTTMPPKVQKISNSVHVGSLLSCTSNGNKYNNGEGNVSVITKNGTSSHTMDIDQVMSLTRQQSEKDIGDILADYEDDLEVGDLEDGGDDDDGFGVDDDTGVSLNSVSIAQNNCLGSITQPKEFDTSSTMEIDSEKPVDYLNMGIFKSSSIIDLNNILTNNSNLNTTATTTTTTTDDDDDDMRCLLRHVQFGRSLVNLVKQVRTKTGGLSLETERLLQQSVSLLAYPSPTSKDCPLRSLLDPIWRDTIASVINSAVLKAHDLPAQPALEQGLRALQRCFQDRNFVEAQTLGHFLFYHLTPTQLAKVDEEVASIVTPQHQNTNTSNKRLRSVSSQDNKERLNEGTHDPSVARSTELNGYNVERRRSRRQRRRREVRSTTTTDSQPNEQCNSLVEEANNNDDDEEEEEDDDDDDEDEDEDGRCDSDDDYFDNGDDDDEPELSGLVVRRPNTRSRDNTTSGGLADSNESSETRGSNGGSSSGRLRSHIQSHVTPLPNPINPLTSVPPNIRLGRQTVLRRYCPAFLFDSTRTRLVAAIPSSISNLHRTAFPNRRLVTSTTSPRSQTRTVPRSSNLINTLESSTSHLDSAFHGLLSMSYPHHAEFLAAMDDALKAYAGSLLLTEDESIISPSSQSFHHQQHRDGPPSPTGGGTCAP